MHGATGIDLAYIAAGILGGRNQFRPPRLGPRRGRRAGAGGRRHRHRPGRRRLDHRRRARRWPARPACTSEMLEIVKSVGDTGGLLMNARDLAVRIIPCLDVDDGRVVKGVNFENLRDAGDPVELAAAYDARGRRRADLPRRHRLVVGPGHHARRRQPHRRAGVHPADRRRRGALGGRRRRAAAGRRRQGRRSTPPPSRGPTCWPRCPVSSGRSASCCRSTRAPCRPGRQPTPSGWEVTTHGGRRGTGIDAVEWAARGAELGVGEILLNSMDADGTKAGFDLPMLRAVRARGHRSR